MNGRKHDNYIITTQNGLQVRVRRLQSDDVPYLLEIFEQMSSNSRYHRFNQAVDNVSEEMKLREAERIAGSDLLRGEGLIAFADMPEMPDVTIGAARYVCVGDGVAEAAMSVIDAVQKQGIGTELMLMLTELAKAYGVRQLIADVRNDNEAIRTILHRMPYEVRWVRDGMFSQVFVDLTRPKLQEQNERGVSTAVS
ncbi:MAG: N-acetyltransferase [Ardenticatenaceae bacterium]|nr:N-acetyltransferase [Anaerolineales bacterium]MCB8921710.1 N-acetyltransferase [Ardenticatenaceae bacterium]MCB8990771.1 N-acetyltransferase [Ardenticatenaceae bacterium]MCB9003258.1 N-acetyltransferase [Ardenticatenaceae bacterium]